MDDADLAPGLLSLTQSALQSSAALYQSFTNVRHPTKALRELKKEVEVLQSMLQALELLSSNDPSSFLDLYWPVENCATTCHDLTTLIREQAMRSDHPITLRKWASLRYKGNSLAHVKEILSIYRSTIAVALGLANLEVCRVTAEVFADYRQMVEDTNLISKEQSQVLQDRSCDLQTRLAPYRWDSLETSEPIRRTSSEERNKLNKEKQITERCLALWEDLVPRLTELLVNGVTKNNEVPADKERRPEDERSGEGTSVAERMTGTTLKEMLATSRQTKTEIRTHLNTILLKLEAQGSIDRSAIELKQEWNSAAAEATAVSCCHSLCAGAESYVVRRQTAASEDVFSSDESQQIVVSTLEGLINLRGPGTVPQTAQLLGQMSDRTLQEVSTVWELTKNAGQSYPESDTCETQGTK